MKTRLLLILTVCLFVSASAMAVPAKRVTKTVRLDNGSTVELTFRGDEYFSFYSDQDGKYYHLTAKGKYEQLTSMEVDSIWTHHKMERTALSNTAQTRKRNMPIRRIGKPSSVTTGKHHGLVILMEFQDVKFVTENPNATFNRFFNETGYSDGGNAGSVQDYFKKQSYGKLEIEFDVVGPYTTEYRMAEYGRNRYDSQNVRIGDNNPYLMVAEAIDQARQDVNFADYDWDNDGYVDQVFVVYAGYNEAQHADVATIWPHESSLEAAGMARKYNGKTISTYGCSSELRGNGVDETGQLDGIGTACHEFSHCLGIPDMYDTHGDSFGMGNWDVMCSGSYNGDSCIPAGYTSYERMFAGWLTPTEIKTMTRINDMKPLATHPEAYILYNEKKRDEFYLLENRQPVDFDSGLYGHGLLITHVDYNENSWSTNSVNVASEHQRMTIIPADNQLARWNCEGDTWPGTTGNTALTNYTMPAATLYNENVDGTKFMSKNIDNITENTANNTVSFVVCRPELGVPQPDGGTEQSGNAAFTVTWPAVSGAIGYELELTEIGSAPTDPSLALVRKYEFEKWYSKTAGYTDIASNNKMPDYGLSGWSGSKLFTSPEKMRIGTSSSTGWVRTPSWRVPESTDFTVVLGAKVFKEGTPVKGNLRMAYGNEGDAPTYEDVAFEVTGDDKLIFHFNVKKDLFYLIIQPNAQMYMNYLAIYDGLWTAEQLGYASNNAANAPKASRPRRANESTYYTTNTNSYTFQNLNTANRYIYRVRALGSENIYSQWSGETTFAFSTTGIQSVSTNRSTPQAIYDLRGQYVGTDINILPKGIYIIQGKKVVK